jgi:hypothetical protein
MHKVRSRGHATHNSLLKMLELTSVVHKNYRVWLGMQDPPTLCTNQSLQLRGSRCLRSENTMKTPRLGMYCMAASSATKYNITELRTIWILVPKPFVALPWNRSPQNRRPRGKLWRRLPMPCRAPRTYNTTALR